MKVFYSTYQKPNFSNSSIFQTRTCSENEDNDSILLLPPPISPILDDSIPSLRPPISIPSLPPPIRIPLSTSKIVTSTHKIHHGYFVPLHTGRISPVSKAFLHSTSSQSTVPTLKAVTLTEHKWTQCAAQLKDQQIWKRIRTSMYNTWNKSQSTFCM